MQFSYPYSFNEPIQPQECQRMPNLVMIVLGKGEDLNGKNSK